MTCREFEHRADSLSLRELSQARDQQILDHAGECQKCASWLQQQRTLAATMQTLQALTATCAADPKVEVALLQAFRQAPTPSVQPEMASGFTPIAMRLSRFFEAGAYVAVAAAILVGVFLGVRLLEPHSVNLPVNSQSVRPSAGSPNVVAEQSGSKLKESLPTISRGSVKRPRRRNVVSARQSKPDTAEPSETDADAGYVALMFCDPLSCSTDSQVVRMELPAQSGQSVQTADLVVGYDGVVRAVRIVN